MPPTRTKASYGLTVNLGEYQSGRVDVGIEEDLREGMSKEQHLRLLLLACRSEARTMAAKLKEEGW